MNDIYSRTKYWKYLINFAMKKIIYLYQALHIKTTKTKYLIISLF